MVRFWVTGSFRWFTIQYLHLKNADCCVSKFILICMFSDCKSFFVSSYSAVFLYLISNDFYSNVFCILCWSLNYFLFLEIFSLQNSILIFKPSVCIALGFWVLIQCFLSSHFGGHIFPDVCQSHLYQPLIGQIFINLS